MRIFFTSSLGLLMSAWLGAAHAVETDVTVRVLAQDAKFIGSGMGGMAVTFRNADTGVELAKGRITGGTGNTELLMKTARERGTALAGEGDAQFTATLDIDQPTRVQIDVRGPLEPAAATQQLRLTTWVAPGKDIAGDGIVMNLPGHAVAFKDLSVTAGRLSVVTDVTMMCGCPFTDGGLWDASKLEVKAMLRQGSETLAEFPLAFTGTTNEFAGDTQLPDGGLEGAKVFIYAYDPETGNTGAAVKTVVD